MTPAALRRFALSLPETVEATHHERRAFRTRKRIYATLARDGREAMVRLADPEEAEALIARFPECFFSHGAWTTRQGALGVRLARVEAGLLRALLFAAWEACASQRARAAHAAAARPRRRGPRAG